MTLPKSRAKSHSEWAWDQTRFHVQEVRTYAIPVYRMSPRKDLGSSTIVVYSGLVQINKEWVKDWARKQDKAAIRALRYFLEAVYGKGK